MAHAVSPVINGLEPFEQELGKGQPEYTPLPVLRGKGPTYTTFSRWRLTDEERELIANGADIIIGQLTFGQLYQPTMLQMVANVQLAEDQIARLLDDLGLNSELDERLLKNLLDK